METMYYIGLDVHKKTIDYCVKDGSGRIYAAAGLSCPAPRCFEIDSSIRSGRTPRRASASTSGDTPQHDRTCLPA
jgi:hypothetical protein